MLLTGARSPINTIISNVPGPQVPLYLCCARLVCSAGCGPLIDHMGLFHAILSYEGGLSITVTACREMLPDPAFYADCIQSSFEELQAVAQRLGRTRRKAMAGGNRKAAARASRGPD